MESGAVGLAVRENEPGTGGRALLLPLLLLITINFCGHDFKKCSSVVCVVYNDQHCERSSHRNPNCSSDHRNPNFSSYRNPNCSSDITTFYATFKSTYNGSFDAAF